MKTGVATRMGDQQKEKESNEFQCLQQERVPTGTVKFMQEKLNKRGSKNENHPSKDANWNLKFPSPTPKKNAQQNLWMHNRKPENAAKEQGFTSTNDRRRNCFFFFFFKK
jgi:hypothetical protein